MNTEVTLLRLRLLALVVEFDVQPIEARRALAAYLRDVADDRGDQYLIGLAEGLESDHPSRAIRRRPRRERN